VGGHEGLLHAVNGPFPNYSQSVFVLNILAVACGIVAIVRSARIDSSGTGRSSRNVRTVDRARVSAVTATGSVLNSLPRNIDSGDSATRLLTSFYRINRLLVMAVLVPEWCVIEVASVGFGFDYDAFFRNMVLLGQFDLLWQKVCDYAH